MNTAIKFLLFWSLSLGGLERSHAIKDCLVSNLSSDIKFGRSAFKPIDENTTLSDLKDIYSSLNSYLDNTLVKDIEARRLINQEDWVKAAKTKGEQRHLYYGKTPIEDWFKGRDYVLSIPEGRAIDHTLLKDIHRVTTQNHTFHGFEGRRIRARFDKGEISREEFRELLDQAYKNNKEVSGVPHSSLVGKYRSDLIDQIEHRGSSFDSSGKRYFTEKELQSLRANKYVTIDEKSIKPLVIGGKPAGFMGKASYMDVQKINENVDWVLLAFDRSLKKAGGNLNMVLEATVKMGRDLMSIHPFLDGNGRTIRLLMDFALKKYGLPPSLYPNEQDFIMSTEELIDFTRKGMRDYLLEHQKHLKQKIPTSA